MIKLTSSSSPGRQHSSLGVIGLWVAVLALLLASGCATATREPRADGPQALAARTDGPALSPRVAGLGSGSGPFQIGPLRVLIRPQPEVELICRIRALVSNQKVDRNQRIHGCYIPADKLIVSTADPYVVLHEFKHYFEGAFHSH